MYAAHRAHALRALTDRADQLGITLPGDIPAQVAHLGDLETEQVGRPDLNMIAADLATHLGDPAAMIKARKAAASDLATADAHQRLTGPFLDRCVAVTHQRIHLAREDIAQLFGDAMTPHLTILNEDAGSLPAGFKPEHAADLDPQRFAAWSRCRDAHTTLAATRAAASLLYGTGRGDAFFTIQATAALAYTDAPDRFSDYSAAHMFARALAGIRHGGSTLGPITADVVFAPTACAHLGARFTWANGPSEVNTRMESIRAAAVQPVHEDTWARGALAFP